MNLYVCKRCKYTTNRRCNFKKHLYRKYVCKAKENDIEIDILRNEFDTSESKYNVNTMSMQSKCNVNTMSMQNSKNICKYCKKTFKQRQGKYLHMKKYCKVKKQKEKEDNELLKMIQELIEDNKEIKETNEKLHDENKEIKKELKKVKNVKAVKAINNQTNIKDSNINININNYGNENISFLTPQFLAKLILQKGVYPLIPNLIKEIHFNKEFPENKNLKITNKKQPYINVYENGNWKLKDKKETIKDIVDDKSNLFDCINSKNDVINLLPRHYHKTRFEKYKDNYDKRDPTTMKKILKNSELEIINSSITEDIIN